MTTDTQPTAKEAFKEQLCDWRKALPGNKTQEQAARILGKIAPLR